MYGPLVKMLLVREILASISKLLRKVYLIYTRVRLPEGVLGECAFLQMETFMWHRNRGPLLEIYGFAKAG
jgi:hypothetical protein